MPLPPELAEFLPEFQSEVREQLRQLENGLLTIEDEVNNQELLKQLMRSIHTIKGSARMMGFMHIGTLAHTMEDVMTLFKGGQMLSTPATVDVLLSGIDLIRSMVGQDPDAEIDISNLVEQLRAVEVAVASEALLTSAEPSRPADPSTASSEASDQMRVSAARLDELLRLMGELVLVGQRIELLQDQAVTHTNQVRSLNRLPQTDSDTTQTYKTLYRSAENLRRDVAHIARELTTTREALEHEVIELRLVPVAEVFVMLPRAVRDLARQTGKDVRLTITGEDTRIDRRILQALNEPLTHIIRNAVDHGLETPAERTAAGKPTAGHLTIEAYRCGSQVCIKISDDGRGISPDKVRQAAMQKGLITPQVAAALDDQAVLDLVYMSGMTTAAHITETSGRGVGMDVVQATLSRLGGNVQLTSQVGQGTTITLELPMTLALIRVLFVQAAGQVYALPDSAIETVVRLTAERLIQENGTYYLAQPDKSVILDSLATVVANADTGFADQIAIILRVGEQEVALTVDRILDERQVVVKSLGNLLGRSEVPLGATFLPDGSVVTILEPGTLVRLIRASRSLVT